MKKNDPVTVIKDFFTAQVGDRKWLYGVAGGLLALGIVSYCVLSYFNNKTVYTHPQTRTITKTKNNIKVSMRKGEAKQTPEGWLLSGNFDLLDTSSILEDTQSKPVFPPRNGLDLVFGVEAITDIPKFYQVEFKARVGIEYRIQIF